jgi:aspartyl-tRNA(Asn)/glutamyl-tRNA(Gln) amidotransferase subunit B
MVVGLEVHVQLKTKTKLFCHCATEFGASPNTQVCPVCLGLPGSLPVLNREAVALAVRTGLALNCRIGEFTKWDRKNYFYPDLPKGYQISQFDLPICNEGYLDIEVDSPLADSSGSSPNSSPPLSRSSGRGVGGEGLNSAAPHTNEALAISSSKRIRLVRAHLEEDAGKSMHDEKSGKGSSRIDLNRTGTPLLEIVSQPDMTSAEEAKAYLTELKLLLEYLDVSDCNMQEGSLRVDANINLHIDREGKTLATPIVEIKNLNSFRAVERALHYEAQRQFQTWKQNGLLIGQAPKQTRGWDDDAGVTTMQREKEESADYRYFPDPDLVPVTLKAAEIEAVRSRLEELPQAKRHRFVRQLGLKPYDAEVIVSLGRSVSGYFEAAVAEGAPPKRAASWMQQDVLRVLKDKQISVDAFPIYPAKLAELLKAIEAGKIDTSRGREVFQNLLENSGLSVDDIIQSLGIVAVDASEIDNLCKELLAANPDVVEKVKAGNFKAVAALIGQARKKNPNADPRQVQERCLALIQSS